MRIAIAGAGIAGLTAAWLLEDSHDVVLLEKRAQPGGNLRTFYPPGTGRVPEAVELGVREVPSAPDSMVMRLAGELGMDRGHWQPLPSGRLLLSDRDGQGRRRTADALEPVPREVAVRAVALMAEHAYRWKSGRLGWEVPLREMVRDFDLPDWVREVAVYSLPAAAFGCTLDEAGALSARAVGELYAEDPSAPAVAGCRPRGGMQSLARRLASRLFRAELALGTALRSVRLRGGGPEVTDTDGCRYRTDALVLAVPADEAARTLSPHFFSPARAPLASYAYRPLLYQVHRSTCRMPVDRRLWAPTTMSVHGARAETTDWHPTSDGDLFVSQISSGAPGPGCPLASASFRTLQPTPGMLRAQRKLLALQGDDGVFFAGHVTTPVNTLENALGSAVAVARRLAPRSRRLARLLADT
ncbi:FAD-dependent oxidoreductase [Streptomyces violaceoruber]|uniref:FAD-dependent oxidoreductase n=1 Tax=Streptomyces violaceoruber TaxID=1935 RepID=UPI003B436533